MSGSKKEEMDVLEINIGKRGQLQRLPGRSAGANPERLVEAIEKFKIEDGSK